MACVCRRNFFFLHASWHVLQQNTWATSVQPKSLRLWAWMKRWSSSLFLRTWHDGANQPPGVGRNESWRMIDEMGVDARRRQSTTSQHKRHAAHNVGSRAEVGETSRAAADATDTVGMPPQKSAKCDRTRRSTRDGHVFWTKHLLDSWCQHRQLIFQQSLHWAAS